jgi:hypothetical protein
MPRVILASVLLVVSLGARSLTGQDTASVAVGAPLRVRTDVAGSWRYGAFGGVRDDSLVLLTQRGTLTRQYALSAISAVELSYVPPGARSKHAGNGAVVGALAGALLLHLAVQHCERTSHHSEGPGCGIGYVGLPFWIGGGAVGGAFIGTAWPVRRWRRVAVIAPNPLGPARPNDR